MGCCTGDEKTYGCCAVPKDSCKGRAAQIVSIIGQIVALITLIVNLVYWTWYFAMWFFVLGLPGIAIGIWICYAAMLIAIVAYSMATCCCTGERGWQCSSAILIVASCLYLVTIAGLAVSHGRLDEMIDKECEEDDDPYSSGDNDNDCDDNGLHGIFGIMYACVIVNLIFSVIAAGLLKFASPEWVAQGDGDAPPVVMAAAADVELANTKA